MALITIPTRTSADLNAAADINALMDNDEYLEGEIPNAAWPVGSFYWQPPSAESNTKGTAFPTAEEPGELFGGTWEQRYNDEGIFFKTEGDPLSQTNGENNERTSGLQTGAFQGHDHPLRGETAGGIVRKLLAADSNDIAGVSTQPQATTYSHLTGNGNRIMSAPVQDGAGNGTPRTGKETRPRNRLMKLWYRTA